jgi:hypothetical protein
VIAVAPATTGAVLAIAAAAFRAVATQEV